LSLAGLEGDIAGARGIGFGFEFLPVALQHRHGNGFGFEFCAWRGGAVGRLPHPSGKLGLVLNSCYTDFGWMPEIGFGSYFGQLSRGGTAA